MEEVTLYGKEGYDVHGMKEGTVMTVDFEIEGQKFVALNGGPVFKFNGKPFHLRCFVKPRRMWTTTGRSFLRAVTERHSSVVG